MNDYKTVDDLADPQIDPEDWQDEWPIDASNFAGMIEWLADAVDARVEYFRRAQAPAAYIAKVEAVAQCLNTAHTEALAAMTAAEDYVSGLNLPDFGAVA